MVYFRFTWMMMFAVLVFLVVMIQASCNSSIGPPLLDSEPIPGTCITEPGEASVS